MLKVYNTLSKKKESFSPRKKGKVNIFTCGPTVYDLSHLGHARTYVVFDMIVKYLKKRGYDVFYLQNITDIDDKIINRAIKEKTPWKDLSRRFEKEYLKDMKSLGINSITKYARATDHINEIISQIERLFKKGYAYKIKDGIYYDISKFKNYGKLAGRTLLQAEDAISRIDESKAKRNKGDFCLWKYANAQATPYEPVWKTPFGNGRPGWHIEDTAICEKYFGFLYDVHGGAKDLIFPHHEAEIAQMEALSDKSPMVKYWLHTGFLTVEGQKMAKSIGNFITIKDFLESYPARTLRFFILKTHYRSPIDYSKKAILQAKKELERIDEFVEKIENCRQLKTLNRNSKFIINQYKTNFKLAMEDDFNTPKAIAIIFNLINKGNALIAENKINRADAKIILGFLREVDIIFNFIFWNKSKEKIPPKLLQLLKLRQKYREEKNWQKADTVRREIKKYGFWIEDTEEGPKIKKIN